MLKIKEELRSLKKDFTVTIIAFFAVHMYCFTNIITNHDDVAIRYYDNYDQTYLGRWLLYYINKITFYTLNTNWSVGVLSSILFAAGIVLIIKIMGLKNRFSKYTAILVMVSFPSVASWNLYTWMTLGFSTGFLLAVTAAYILQCIFPLQKKIFTILGIAISSIMLSLSLGCYQAFVCIFFVLIWYLVLSELLSSTYKWKNLPRYVCYSIISFIIAFISYSLTLSIVLKSKNIALTDYQGIAAMGKVSLWNTIESIQMAYSEFIDFYLYGYGISFLKMINMVVLAGFILLALYECYHCNRRIWEKGIIVLLILIMPVIINSICIMTQGNSEIYSCMYFTYVFLYLLFLRFAETQYNHKWKTYISQIAVVTTVLFYFMVTNQAYGNQDAVLNNIQQYFNRVAMRIECVEGFDEKETPVYFSTPVSITEYPIFQGGVLDTTDPLQGIIYNNSGVHAFMQSYCGFNPKSVSDGNETIQHILNSDEYAAMENYPAESSIRIIGDILVVKFK